jgi:hypothetical protein
MIYEMNESIWRQSDVSSWRRDGEDLACCYGNLIDAAGSRRKSTLCAKLVTWKHECHVANQIAPGSELATTFTQQMPQKVSSTLQ